MIAGRFKLVIFDCDGVLVDSEPIINRAHAEVLTALRISNHGKSSRRALLRHERSGNARNHRARVGLCAACLL
jgi:beta-phosphoglucomutase-like phosphatase (HAD superfamily)